MRVRPRHDVHSDAYPFREVVSVKAGNVYDAGMNDHGAVWAIIDRPGRVNLGLKPDEYDIAECSPEELARVPELVRLRYLHGRSIPRQLAGDVLDRAREAVVAVLQHYRPDHAYLDERQPISEFEFTRMVVAHLHDWIEVDGACGGRNHHPSVQLDSGAEVERKEGG